jgi:hypothetical protein
MAMVAAALLATPASTREREATSPSAGVPVESWHEATLCETGENVVWSCRTKRRTVSVCASRRMTATQGYFQYRAGQPGKLELVYPAQRVHPRGRFKYQLYIQGNTSLSFSSGGFSYSLVDDLRSPDDEVIVEKGDKLISRSTCNNGGEGFSIVRPDLLGIADTPYGN